MHVESVFELTTAQAVTLGELVAKNINAHLHIRREPQDALYIYVQLTRDGRISGYIITSDGTLTKDM